MHNFNNMKFDCKPYNDTVTKWKDFNKEVCKIAEKIVTIGKFRQNYNSEVVDGDDNVGKVCLYAESDR